SAPWLIEWTLTLWPLNVDASLATGARLMVERIDLTASAGEPLHSFLMPLFASNRPWSELGRLALTIALASRDGDLRRLATDLLSEGIADSRADPGELAGMLRRLAAGGWLKANRLSETLREVARRGRWPRDRTPAQRASSRPAPSATPDGQAGPACPSSCFRQSRNRCRTG
ncbi:MAG TPA: DUF6493 family protein, partial [Azospira sp.]|nr:DUF6493 family protein [Accumulibacter sp.]HNJ77694.1 DUF6493 family protein [Azospira sp.]